MDLNHIKNRYYGIKTRIEELFDVVAMQIKIDGSEEGKIIAAFAFNKIRYGFKAAYLLIDNGFLLESGHIARALIENYYILKSNEYDSTETVRRLKANEKIRYKKFIKQINSNGKYREHKEVYGDIDIPLEKNEVKTTVENWASLSQCQDDYDYVYSFLSDEMHANLFSLKKNATYVEGELHSFDILIDDNDAVLRIHTLLGIALNTIETMAVQFALEMPFQFELIEIEEEMEDIYLELSKQMEGRNVVV